MADGFRSRVDTNVVARAQPIAASFKSGLAEGLTDVGRALGDAAATDARVQEQVAASEARIAAIEKQRRQAVRSSETQVALAQLDADATTKKAELRAQSKPGATGHAAAFDAWMSERVTSIADTLLDDDELATQFAPSLARLSAGAKAGEQAWELTSRVKYQVGNREQWRSLSGNALLGTPIAELPAKLDAVREQARAGTALLEVDGTTRAAIEHDDDAYLVKSALDSAMQQGGHGAVEAWLGAGLFDAVLSPDDKTNYLRRVGVAKAQDANEVDRAVARQQEAARDGVKALKAKIDAGITPSAGEFDAVQGAAKTAGLDAAEMIDLGAMEIGAEVNRRYGGWAEVPGGADRLRSERDAIRDRIARGKGTEADQVTAAQIDRLVDKADKSETDPLADLVKKGPAGVLQALSAISGSPETRYEKAEKLQKGLGGLAVLGPRARSLAVRGGEVRKARPKDFGAKDRIAVEARAIVGPALAGELGGEYPGIVDRAWDIMAALSDGRNGDGFDAGTFREAMLYATGATTRSNGVLQGGIAKVRGQPVQLPDWSTAAEFDRDLSRLDFSQARYANGAPAKAADVLAHYRPSFVGDDADGNPTYQMVDAGGGSLALANGRPMVITTRRHR